MLRSLSYRLFGSEHLLRGRCQYENVLFIDNIGIAYLGYSKLGLTLD
jgi:hypothetical protein